MLQLAALADMTVKDQSGVPTWDGNPRVFVKYKTPVEWYVSGIKTENRKYIVGRLLPGLTGAAGTLVSKWRARDYETEDGAYKFLEKAQPEPSPQAGPFRTPSTVLRPSSS